MIKQFKFIIFSHYIHIKYKSVVYDELKVKEHAILNANSIYALICLFSPLYNIILSQTEAPGKTGAFCFSLFHIDTDIEVVVGQPDPVLCKNIPHSFIECKIDIPKVLSLCPDPNYVFDRAVLKA